MKMSITPDPVEFEMKAGTFTIRHDTLINVENAAARAGAYLGSLLSLPDNVRQCDGMNPEQAWPAGSVILKVATSAETIGAEGYHLDITPDRIGIIAAGEAGFFNAVQSLRQLLPHGIEKRAAGGNVEWAVPCASVTDWPRFSWRGLLLDTARFFKPKEFVLRYIDLMALFKFNRLHLHLTDDQGWRIEIGKHPELTSIGAWREKSRAGKLSGTGPAHGGFYTKADIREIVEFAAARGVTVVPEIDMPGHMRAAIASVPGLNCTGKPVEVWSQWGVGKEVLCVGRESTFGFVEDVLDEVMEMFPGEYIHIGGDECPRARWRECPECQARMKSENLESESALQKYFIGRIARFIESRGRKMIGWDEIIEDGIPDGATVMSWRGMNGGITAAQAGHDVIMTPTSHCYLDYPQALTGEPKSIPLQFLPLCRVYSFEPVPKTLERTEAANHILGIQGCVWSEFIPDERKAEYMTFPRAVALAEVAWSQKHRRSWPDFKQRLDYVLERLDALEVNYRNPKPGEGAFFERLLLLHPDLWDKADNLKTNLATGLAKLFS